MLRYYSLVERLNSLPHVYIPDQYPEVTIVGDSIQMTFQGQVGLLGWGPGLRVGGWFGDSYVDSSATAM